MRHRIAGRTLGRRSNQRKALFRGLVTNLIESERITTTLAKAKELRRYVEPLITLAKKGDLHSRRLAAGQLYKKEALQKLFSDIAPRFQDRPGGYTRIFKYKVRQGDGADLAMIEFVTKAEQKPKSKDKKALAPKKAKPTKGAASEKAPAAKKAKSAKSTAPKKVTVQKKALTQKAKKAS